MILLVLFLPVIAYLGAINIRTYRAFAADKQFAIKKQQRTPEATLLRLACIGGWGGAKIAQHRLRHKTYKQPFGRQLNAIGALQAASAMTLVLIFGLLSLVPPAYTINAVSGAAQATDAGRALRPADAQLLILLRPPAGRRAKL